MLDRNEYFGLKIFEIQGAKIRGHVGLPILYDLVRLNKKTSDYFRKTLFKTLFCLCPLTGLSEYVIFYKNYLIEIECFIK
jgi:hypothetical protein